MSEGPNDIEHLPEFHRTIVARHFLPWSLPLVAWSAGFDSRQGPPAGAQGSSELPPADQLNSRHRRVYASSGRLSWSEDLRQQEVLAVVSSAAYLVALFAVWYIAALSYGYQFLQETLHDVEEKLGWKKLGLPPGVLGTAGAAVALCWPNRHFVRKFERKKREKGGTDRASRAAGSGG